MTCKYCNPPYKIFDNGDRVIPPIGLFDWWGLMPRYKENRLGTIIKIDYCPMCGRELDDSV